MSRLSALLAALALRAAATEGVQVVAGVDTRPAQLAAFQEAHAIPHGFPSIEAALAWGALHGWIVPRVDEWRPTLEREASRVLGVPVRIGAVTVAVNWRLVPREIAYIVQDAGARLLLTQSAVLDNALAVRASSPTISFAASWS